MRSNSSDPDNACTRAADLHGEPVIAWRYPRTFVGAVHHSQVVG
jgi:hypothetical protein